MSDTEFRTLLLLRHAKSDWDDPALTDFDRPLAPRGEAAAPVMGAHMKAKGWLPDAVLCSPARRTRETWALVAEAAGVAPPACPVTLVDQLYDASPHMVIEAIKTAPAEARTLCVVGHHPGIDGTALVLAGSGDRAAMDRIRMKFPTAALAVLRIPLASWSALAPGTGELTKFVRPKDLG